MVALVARMTSVGGSLKEGIAYSTGFNTEASRDLAADRSNINGKSVVEKLSFYAGGILGGALDILTLGYGERKSHNELVYGKSDVSYSSFDLGGDMDARESRLNGFVARYAAKHGIDIEEESSAGNLEETVEGADAAQRRVDANVREYGAVSESSDDNGERYANRVDDVDKAYGMALKEDEGRVMMYKDRLKRNGGSLEEKSLISEKLVGRKLVGKKLENYVAGVSAELDEVEERIKKGKKVVEAAARSVGKYDPKNAVGEAVEGKKIYGVDVDGLGNGKLREFISWADDEGMDRSEIAAYVNNFRKRDKKNVWKKRKAEEKFVYEAMNKDFDFDFGNMGWSGDVALRIMGQREALSNKLKDLSGTDRKLAEKIVRGGYVSSLGIPVLYTDNDKDDENLPRSSRGFNDKEVRDLVDKIAPKRVTARPTTTSKPAPVPNPAPVIHRSITPIVPASVPKPILTAKEKRKGQLKDLGNQLNWIFKNDQDNAWSYINDDDVYLSNANVPVIKANNPNESESQKKRNLNVYEKRKMLDMMGL